MQLKKKVAVIAGSAIAAMAVATGAWAYVTASGAGRGTATTSAGTATLTLSASASITDLDVPAKISVTGKSDKANRHISTLHVTIDTTAPVFTSTCQAGWFSIDASGTAFAGHTFTTANHDDSLDPGVAITMKNDPNADQTACVGQDIPLLVTAS